MFTIYVISLKDRDGLESLNRIKSKIENNETLNGEDIVLLISIVFMKSDFDESQLLFKIADLTNKAKFESEFLKDQVKALQVILGEKFIEDEEELERFWRIVKMESVYFSPFERLNKKYVNEVREEAIEEGMIKGRVIGIDEGKELGRVEGRIEGKMEGKMEGRVEGREEGNEEKAIFVASWMLKKNMSIDDIREATGLSIDKINSLKENGS